MNKPSLFELSKEQLELLEMVENSSSLDGEIDEFTEAALEIHKMQYVEKAADYIAVIQEKVYQNQRAKDAMDQIKAFEAANDRVINKLKNKLEDATKLFGPVQVGFNKLSLRKSDETIITDMAKIPEQYLTRKEVISADKTKIKKSIKSGEEVPGAHINTKENLQIK